MTQTDQQRDMANEYVCNGCGTGRVMAVKETPSGACDMCGSDGWRFAYDRTVGAGG